MACRTETVIIRDAQYNITQMPATQAVALQLQLTKLFGAEVVNLFSDSSSMTKLFSKLDPQDLIALIKTLIESKLVTKKYKGEAGEEVDLPVRMDNFSTDEMIDIYILTFRVIQVNLQRFFLDLKSKSPIIQTLERMAMAIFSKNSTEKSA